MIDDSSAEEVIARIRSSDANGRELRKIAMAELAKFDSYDWCGVYRLKGNSLILDEFVGEPTEHTEIPVGLGVCGTAVAENRNQIVNDVSKVGNYLSCSIQTKSEIVVLIKNDDELLGQIDVDCHKPDAFDGSDEVFLERVATILAVRWHS
jgi:L-methionine (R)-S-oxide reductase